MEADKKEAVSVFRYDLTASGPWSEAGVQSPASNMFFHGRSTSSSQTIKKPATDEEAGCMTASLTYLWSFCRHVLFISRSAEEASELEQKSWGRMWGDRRRRRSASGGGPYPRQKVIRLVPSTHDWHSPKQ